MLFVRCLTRTLLALLFAMLGTVATFAAPGDWTQVSYPVEAQELSAQRVKLAYTARAPPPASANVTSGGNAVNVNQGASVARSAVANNRQLHVQEAELIGLYAGVFAREQGISVEEATALLTAETLIGISDDFAHLESDAAARAFLDGLAQSGQVVDGQTLFGQLDRGSDEYLNSQQNYQYVSQLTDLYAGVPYEANADRAQGQVAMALGVFDGSENRGVDTFLAYQAAQDSVYFLNNGTTWIGQSQDAAATYINTSIHSGRLMAAGDPAAEMFNVSGFTIGAINGLHAGGHEALIEQVGALSDEDLGAYILGQQGSLLEFGLAVASGSSFRTTLSERLAAFGAQGRSNFLSGGATNTGLTATQRQGILREASQLGQGNLTLAGRATRAEAADLGEAWVGPGYRTASDGRTLVSADGTRTFRPPTPKPNSPFSETGVQVNFETRELIDGRWTVRSNAHLDVSD
jgi:hypothetical protein